MVGIVACCAFIAKGQPTAEKNSWSRKHLPFQTLARNLQTPNNTNADQSPSNTQQCSINVEVFYWGCNTFLQTTNVKESMVVLRNLHLNQTRDTETCNCTALSTFPDINTTRVTEADYYELDRDANNTLETVQIQSPYDDNSSAILVVQQVPLAKDAGTCNIAVGRPFRDEHGNIVSSHIIVDESESHNTKSTLTSSTGTWSQPTDPLLVAYKRSYILGSQAAKYENAFDNVVHLQELATVWRRRALGEHSSIASFAAFSMALMSNCAPPDLIGNALEAAQDELRHAKVSFEVASLLATISSGDSMDKHGGVSGKVEPSRLPPSNLAFGYNLTALALGVIQEGCFDETLSAFEMAEQVDISRSVAAASVDKSVSEALRDLDILETTLMTITRKIALEEGRHSALAWRTVQWICRADAQVCNNTVKPNLAIQRDALNTIGKRRLQGEWGSTLREKGTVAVWACLHEQLADHVISETLHQGVPSESCDIGSGISSEQPLVSQLARQIFDNVIGSQLPGSRDALVVAS